MASLKQLNNAIKQGRHWDIRSIVCDLKASGVTNFSIALTTAEACRYQYDGELVLSELIDAINS